MSQKSKKLAGMKWSHDHTLTSLALGEVRKSCEAKLAGLLKGAPSTITTRNNFNVRKKKAASEQERERVKETTKHTRDDDNDGAGCIWVV